METVHDSPLPESFNPFTESQKKVSCSNKVRVIVETNVPRRASSWIIAEDKGSSFHLLFSPLKEKKKKKKKVF